MMNYIKNLEKILSKYEIADSIRDEITILISNMQNKYNDLREDFSDLEYKYKNLEYDYNNLDFYDVCDIECLGTREIIEELDNRRFSVLSSSNLYENDKVEILKNMYDNYNLVELQQIYERLNRK